MNESRFIEQNTARWQLIESWINNDRELTIEEATRAYAEVSDDLAYAQTHFPDSQTTYYLNAMASHLHRKLYDAPTQSALSRLKRFYSHTVPLAMYEARWVLLTVFVLFVVTVLIGMFSTQADENFARSILGDRYVDMTIENIRSGDPAAVYRSGEPTFSFLMIAWNNVRVALMVFAMGVFTFVGSIMIIAYNGVMTGSFITFFNHYGVMGDAALSIMQHGTLELSTIVIEGCASFVMGNGWLFPGTMDRGRAFVRSARRGATIMLGNLPMVIVAALIEGYFTRYTDAPVALKVAVIVVSLAFVLWYFVWLPQVRHRQQQSQ